MTNNADMPAMPCGAEQTLHNPGYDPVCWGLTKRETFAMTFHAALLTATNEDGDWKGVNVDAATIALDEADKLLAALEDNQQ